MQLFSVAQQLALMGLREPPLVALQPNHQNYTVLLLQPKGDIDADANGVHHHDRMLAHHQCKAFLEAAVHDAADLVVTPEYCMPWGTLRDAITDGLAPPGERLWALGCESITYAELQDIRNSLQNHAIVVFENLEPNPSRFLDPLAYVFHAPSLNLGEMPRLVVLVQFKTSPMRDPDHFEVNGLQCGTRVYQFGTDNFAVRLTTILCSDVFALEDEHAQQMYDRGLVLHLQLMPDPRHVQYKFYRQRLFQNANGFTELICLNWAHNVMLRYGGTNTSWGNNSSSAWYLRPTEFDIRDITLCTNHSHGLYYTWCFCMRSHVMFLNFEPAVFLLTASKVYHRNVPAAISNRRGPRLDALRTWDQQSQAWALQAHADDGFAQLVGACGIAPNAVSALATIDPFATERVLALATGHISVSEDWHSVYELDSCRLGQDEIIRRITFCQDNDVNAYDFRTERLRLFGLLWTILSTPAHLPPALSDLGPGFTLTWTSNSPHQNVQSNQGARATVSYLGEAVMPSRLEAFAKTTAEFLHRQSSDPDASNVARQRMAVWYRDDAGIIQLYAKDRYLGFDDPRSASEFDIARTT